MRHGSSGRRQRNRGNRRGGNNRSQVFDSNGPDVRIRGTAHQIHEKYTALARDAAGSGDRILEQSYLQHAEHYQRIINGWDDADNERRANAAKENARQEKDVSKSSPRKKAADKKSEDLGLPESITGEAKKEKELEDV